MTGVGADAFLVVDDDLVVASVVVVVVEVVVVVVLGVDGVCECLTSFSSTADSKSLLDSVVDDGNLDDVI